MLERNTGDCVIMALEDGIVLAFALCSPEKNGFVEAPRGKDLAVSAELCGEDLGLSK